MQLSEKQSSASTYAFFGSPNCLSNIVVGVFSSMFIAQSLVICQTLAAVAVALQSLMKSRLYSD